MKTYYEILDILPTSSPDEIKKAFRRNSLKNHPDKGGSDRVFQEVNTAYRTLSNLELKATYDRTHQVEIQDYYLRKTGSYPTQPNSGTDNQRSNLKSIHRNAQTRDFFSPDSGQERGIPPHPNVDERSSMLNFAKQFYPIQEVNSYSVGRTQVGEKADYLQSLDTNTNTNTNTNMNTNPPGHNHSQTISDLYTNYLALVPPNPLNRGTIYGFEKPVPIQKSISVTLHEAYTGAQKPIDVERWVVNQMSRTRELEKEILYVDIPAGSDNGEMLILREKGHILSEHIKGDIKIFLSIDNQTKFTREGLNLILEYPITLAEALCGVQCEFTHLNGKPYKLYKHTRENVINTDFIKKIPKLGMTRGEKTGDLILKFKIVFPNPKNWTDNDRETLTQILNK